LTALLAAGFTRFLLGLWPAIVTAVVLGSWSVINRRIEGRKGQP
jgi:integral membrane sensor domain MASE1